MLATHGLDFDRIVFVLGRWLFARSVIDPRNFYLSCTPLCLVRVRRSVLEPGAQRRPKHYGMRVKMWLGPTHVLWSTMNVITSVASDVPDLFQNGQIAVWLKKMMEL